MTDLLLQAKKRLTTADLAFTDASDVLQSAMFQLDESKKIKNKAQADFETKISNYSLAIQNANRLESQPYLLEEDLAAANRAFDYYKKEYEAALKENDKQKKSAQDALYDVIKAQASYDVAKLEFDAAKYDYDRILRERKLPLLSENDNKDDGIPDDNIDFLMNFLSQHPLPDYESSEIDPLTGASYDPTVPFENRPAVEPPSSNPYRTGHITWYFDPSHRKKYTGGNKLND
jgi:hypothetical protein